MFNIANIRSGIMQKLGVSTQNEEAVKAEDVSSDSIPQPSCSEGIVINPQVCNSVTDSGNTLQDRHTASTNLLLCNRESVNVDTEINEDSASHNTITTDRESVQVNVKMVIEENEVDKEAKKTVMPNDENDESLELNGSDVKNDKTDDPSGQENGSVSSPSVITEGAISSTNWQCHPSTCNSTEDLQVVPADKPVSVSYTSGSQSNMITESYSHMDSLTQQQRDTANLEADLGIVIKTEKFDEGYERHSAFVAQASSFAEINEKLDGFDNVFIPKRERVDDEGDKDDVIILGVGYRNPYSDSDGSDSESSISSFETDYTNRRGSSPPHEHEDVYEDSRTKGELFPEDLPPLEDLQISISDTTKLVQIGEVTGIVDILVVIKSTLLLDGRVLPVNEDTVFFFENRKPFGKVFEVFGPTRSPFYSVRFNSPEDVVNKGVDIGLKVFFVPEPEPELEDITHYVFVDSLLKIKGSDASWQDNNEPPPSMLDYSDDEEEKRSKSKRKGKKKQEGEEGGDMAKAKKGNNTNSAVGEGTSSSSDASQRRYKRPANSQRGRGGFGGSFSGSRPPFAGPRAGGMNGQQPPIIPSPNNRMDSQHPPMFSGSRNRMDFNRPPMFSGPNSRMDSPQQAPMFSGPSDRMAFQRPPAFSGPPGGMNSQPSLPLPPPPPMFSSPVGGMPSQQPPVFSSPPNGINSQPPPLPMFSGPPSGMNSQPPPQAFTGPVGGLSTSQPPPPVFSRPAGGMSTSQPPPPPPPTMFSGSANRLNSHPPFNFSGPPANVPPPPHPSMFSAPSHQPHQFGCWVPPQPNPAFLGTQGNPGQGAPQWGYPN